MGYARGANVKPNFIRGADTRSLKISVVQQLQSLATNNEN